MSEQQRHFGQDNSYITISLLITCEKQNHTELSSLSIIPLSSVELCSIFKRQTDKVDSSAVPHLAVRQPDN